MKRAMLALLLVVLASCGAGHMKVIPNTQGVLCVWPDPIVFSPNDDSWNVCFRIPYGTDPPVCLTVGELRRVLVARKLAESVGPREFDLGVRVVP